MRRFHTSLAVTGFAERVGAHSPGGTSSSVHLTAVADANHQNAQGAVLDVRDDAVITHPVFPEITELGAFQRLAKTARIVHRRDASAQKFQNALACLWIELANARDDSSIRQVILHHDVGQ
jgi:hypothetical protein